MLSRSRERAETCFVVKPRGNSLNSCRSRNPRWGAVMWYLRFRLSALGTYTKLRSHKMKAHNYLKVDIVH